MRIFLVLGFLLLLACGDNEKEDSEVLTMTVFELIEQLQKYPSRAVVVSPQVLQGRIQVHSTTGAVGETIEELHVRTGCVGCTYCKDGPGPDLTHQTQTGYAVAEKAKRNLLP